MAQKVHIMHGRDHEHSGADPILIAWEDVGDGGSGGGGGGIQFDTTPQAGGFLDITTTTGNLDLMQEAPDHDLNLYAQSSGINITGGEGTIIEGLGDTGVIIKATGLGDLMIRHDNVDGYVKINANGINGEARIYGKAGARLTSDGAVIIAGTTGVLIVGLPTTNPGVTDQLWNDGGTVKIA